MQHDDTPELLTLACTIARWESEPVCAVLAGVTNARSKSLNRIAKLEALTRPAPSGGVTVELTSSAPALAAVPSGVTIPAGSFLTNVNLGRPA